mmetsp:Transcript_5403/g.11362  ORF Transcript_5403/g.11362 Transcript_5403/m.11362 type:complete len:305 (+) Transcript_5403:237-1151(+)
MLRRTSTPPNTSPPRSSTVTIKIFPLRSFTKRSTTSLAFSSCLFLLSMNGPLQFQPYSVGLILTLLRSLKCMGTLFPIPEGIVVLIPVTFSSPPLSHAAISISLPMRLISVYRFTRQTSLTPTSPPRLLGAGTTAQQRLSWPLNLPMTSSCAPLPPPTLSPTAPLQGSVPDPRLPATPRKVSPSSSLSYLTRISFVSASPTMYTSKRLRAQSSPAPPDSSPTPKPMLRSGKPPVCPMEGLVSKPPSSKDFSPALLADPPPQAPLRFCPGMKSNPVNSAAGAFLLAALAWYSNLTPVASMTQKGT